ncbi:unnamed protein product [Symbiodinium sp. KB8]|nr:unnamed protein product [Symbiodinium sp. KB8]
MRDFGSTCREDLQHPDVHGVVQQFQLDERTTLVIASFGLSLCVVLVHCCPPPGVCSTGRLSAHEGGLCSQRLVLLDIRCTLRWLFCGNDATLHCRTHCHVDVLHPVVRSTVLLELLLLCRSLCFWVSKYYEMLDTVLSICRRSSMPHFYFHVYHHCVVPAMVWGTLQWVSTLQHAGMVRAF